MAGGILRRMRSGALAGVAVTFGLGLVSTAQATAATTSVNTTVKMSDGVRLTATVSGQAPLKRRPLIIEFSPYGPGSGTTHDGSAYNYLLVQDRGTGASPGAFDALGPRSQLDVQQTLRWACHQPFSDGRIALNGFSASAVAIYNSLHLRLPCVDAAVLKSGTFSLYRDLLYPGGVNNVLPGAAVVAMIGAPTLQQGPARLKGNPLAGLLAGVSTGTGFFRTGTADLAHQSLDSFWQARQYRGDANRFPVLMVDSFYDVESQGAFAAFRALPNKADHLLVVAGHDGQPAGTDGGTRAIKGWFDHYLRGVRNGIQRTRRVQMLLSEGSRESYNAGRYLRVSGGAWPLPGTRWQSLALNPARSHSAAGSLNDGSLTPRAPMGTSRQLYTSVPSNPTATDPANAAAVGPDGLNQAAAVLPQLTQTKLSEPLGLTYTTAPLRRALRAAGPAALDLNLASTAPSTVIWVVISDVWPDGTSHPVASARLNTAYPTVNRNRSIVDRTGQIVGPFGNFSVLTSTKPGTTRRYQVAFWPIGNKFSAGDRIRLTLVGPSGASLPTGVAVNTVTLGGRSPSRLLLPALP